LTESFLDEDPALDVFDLPIVLVRWHALLAADDEQRHRGRRKERQSSVRVRGEFGGWQNVSTLWIIV
jgi:hypothetical protein